MADTVYQGKGKIIGVMPRFLLKIEKLYDHLDEEYMVDTMSQRKQKMIDLAQGFIALPGGPGTLEEITEIISLVRLDQLPYPCVLYNLDGYYDTLKQQLDVMIKEGFYDAEGIKMYILSPVWKNWMLYLAVLSGLLGHGNVFLGS